MKNGVLVAVGGFGDGKAQSVAMPSVGLPSTNDDYLH